MKNSSILSTFCLLIISISCGESLNKDFASSNLKVNLNELENYVNRLEKEGLYGSLLLMENDRVLFEKSIGFSNKEKGVKSNKETIYPFGSIVKDYTRAVLLLLVTEGKLELEDKLVKFYADIPEDKKEITVAHLLQHKSGLQPHHETSDLREKYHDIPADLWPGTKQEALSAIFSQELKFTPGEQQSYSNSGYTLLAYLIEDLMGQRFEEVLNDRIFTPAKMITADFYRSELWTPKQVAVCYGTKSFGKENSPLYWPRNPNQLIGNGGVAGTLDDLYKGLKYLLDLEESNIAFKALSQKYKQYADIPADIIGSSGGGPLGNIAVVFGIKSTNQYLIFASNNDVDGMEDLDMLRQIVLLGFGYDIASLAPEEFEITKKKENQREQLNKSNLTNSKWGLPNKLKYERIAGFLDFLTNDINERIFLDKHCSNSSRSKIQKQIIDYKLSNAIVLKRLESFEREFTIKVRDTISREEHTYEIVLDRGSKIKSIRLSQSSN